MQKILEKYISFRNLTDTNIFREWLEQQIKGEDTILVLCGPGCSGKTFAKDLILRCSANLGMRILPTIIDVSIVGSSSSESRLSTSNDACVVVNLAKIPNPRHEAFEEALCELRLSTKTIKY